MNPPINQPYPTPTATPTKLRCLFRLPGKRYDCRHIGKYILDGRRYCALHYDVAWKVAHPVFGTQHDYKDKRIGEKSLPVCSRCGGIQPYEGLPQSPCRGVAGRIGRRANS